MASATETMYKNSPRLERNKESGKMGVSKKEKESTHDNAGTDGMEAEDRHIHERREMHGRHQAEHVAMHHRHELEHMHHKGDKKELHDRHEREHEEVHTRHEKEKKSMHDRHEKEMGGKESKGSGEGKKKIEKVESGDEE